MKIIGLELPNFCIITILFDLAIFLVSIFVIFLIIYFFMENKYSRLFICIMTMLLPTLVSLSISKFKIFEYMDKNLTEHYLKIYYTNENSDNITIKKDQIINDIINGKISKNENNSNVYTQLIQINYDEYQQLKQYKNTDNIKSLKNGNVKIIN